MRGMRVISSEFETANLRNLPQAEAPTALARIQSGFFEHKAGAVQADSKVHQKWDVFLDGELIDSVFWVPSADAEEVKDSLIEHDGYDPAITVSKEGHTATKKTAGGWGRFSEDLADALEGQVLMHKQKADSEIREIIKADPNLTEMMKEESMDDDELLALIEDAKLLYGPFKEATKKTACSDVAMAIVEMPELSVKDLADMFGINTDEADYIVNQLATQTRDNGTDWFVQAVTEYLESPTAVQRQLASKTAAIYDGYGTRLTIETRAGDTNESYTSVVNMLSEAGIRYREIRRYTIDPDRVMLDVLVKSADVDVVKELAKEGEKDGILITYNDNITEQIKPKQIVTPEDEVTEDLPKTAAKAVLDDEPETPEEELEEQEGPEDGDYVLYDSGNLGSKTSVSEVGGSHLGEFRSTEEAENFIRKRMRVEQFWPSVWYQDDHGGIQPHVLEN